MATTIKTKAIIFYLEPEDHKAIKKLAFKHELTISELMRLLSEKALELDANDELDFKNEEPTPQWKKHLLPTDAFG